MAGIKKSSIYIIGDSHVALWSFAKQHCVGSDHIDIVGAKSVAAKSAQGLSNKKNRNLFINPFKKYGKYVDYFATCLGEVDCGYTIWSRMKRRGSSQMQEIRYAVDKLISFCKELPADKIGKVLLFAPVIPLVDSYQELKKKVLAKRRPAAILPAVERRLKVRASHKERTDLVLRFERQMGRMADENGFKVLSVNDILLDEKTGVAKKEYIDAALDWHLPVAMGARLWTQEVIDFIRRQNG